MHLEAYDAIGEQIHSSVYVVQEILLTRHEFSNYSNNLNKTIKIIEISH